MSKKSLQSEIAPPLAETRIESNSGVGMPLLFQPSASGAAVDVGDPLVQRTNYALFVSPKGQSFAKLLAHIPDLQDGDPVLVPTMGTPAKLSPFVFYLLRAWQHFSIVNSMGVIQKSIFGEDAAKLAKERSTKDAKYLEHIETILLIVHGGKVYPARCTFKTTKVNAIRTAINTLAEAQDAESWSKKSEAHRVSSAAPLPWARFTSSVRLKSGLTSQSSGFNFVAAYSHPTPTSVAEWQTLAAAMKDPDFARECDECLTEHGRRMEAIKSK